MGWRYKRRFFGLAISFDELPILAEKLMDVLTNLAMRENPVYRYSPLLRTLAADLRDTPLHRQEKNRLQQFIRQNNMLNLESYVTFRMGDYAHALNMVGYRLIRQINF